MKNKRIYSCGDLLIAEHTLYFLNNNVLQNNILFLPHKKQADTQTEFCSVSNYLLGEEKAVSKIKSYVSSTFLKKTYGFFLSEEMSGQLTI